MKDPYDAILSERGGNWRRGQDIIHLGFYEFTQHCRSVRSKSHDCFPNWKCWQYAKPSLRLQLDFMGLYAYDVTVWISGDTTELVCW